MSIPHIYTHQVHISRRGHAHYLALTRHTFLSPEQILRLSLEDGLSARARNGCKQADINALDELLQIQEQEREKEEP